jgi:NADH-quinone oxidoreductase subunit E
MHVVENTSYLLPQILQNKIEDWIKKYPKERKQSALLAALVLTQEYNHGWLSEDLIHAVADFLAVSRVTVHEVVSFYSLFDVAPVGKYKINVCTNVSCMLRGCDVIVSHLKKRLNIDFNQTTSDGKITLKEVECLGVCIHAPVAQVGKHYWEELTIEKVDQLLDNLDD